MKPNVKKSLEAGRAVLDVELVRLPHAFDAPEHKTTLSAGVDLQAAISAPISLGAGKTAMIPTGLKIAIKNHNYAAFVFPRSGKATKEGLILANTVGVIDADYRGEIMIAVHNRNSYNPVLIEPGERIAQMVLLPAPTINFIDVEELDETARGEGGFGSTGGR